MRTNGFKKRIVIVDNEKFAEGISFIIGFNNKYSVVNSYESAEEAIKNIKRERPELMLIELDLLGLDGLAATRKIKQDWPNIEVLIMSFDISIDVIIDALSSGATGYVCKNESFANELINFLDSVDQGGAPLSPDVARKLVETFWKNPSSPLSYRETTVLKLISEGNTYSEIGALLNISKDTSKSHIRNIYKKLEVSSRSQAVRKGMTERLI